MLDLALLFFIVALIAALFGFGGIAAGIAQIAQVLFFIFLVVFSGLPHRGPFAPQPTLERAYTKSRVRLSLRNSPNQTAAHRETRAIGDLRPSRFQL